MSKYYLLAYRTQYGDCIHNDVITVRPFKYMLDMALEGEYLYFISAIRITKRQYRRFKILKEEELPEWWIE